MRNFNKLYFLISILLVLIGIILNIKSGKKEDIFLLSEDLIIDKINENNRDIRSLNCNIKSFKIVPATGYLYYEKDANFRFLLNSIFDKELDLGSNKEIYWFWIKRFDKKIYYWERNKNSQLIDEFDPEYVKESLGVDAIPKNSIVLKSNNNLYKIISYRKNQSGNDVIKIWIVFNEKITEHQLYNDQGNLIIKCSIKKFTQINNKQIPSEIEITSNQLNCTLQLEEIKINEKIDESKWKMPNNQESINISK